VIDTRPLEAQTDYTDPTGVQKYEMPQAEYETLADSVLSWKKKERLGRFDPATVGAVEARVGGWQRDVEERGTFSFIASGGFVVALLSPAVSSFFDHSPPPQRASLPVPPPVRPRRTRI
jgi:hypothetical protein